MQRLQIYIDSERCVYEPRDRIDPSAAKTKTKVERNSAKVALMESGCVASSALPKP